MGEEKQKLTISDQDLKNAIAFHSFSPSQDPYANNDTFCSKGARRYPSWPLTSRQQRIKLVLLSFLLVFIFVFAFGISSKTGLDRIDLVIFSMLITASFAVFKLEQQRKIASDKNGQDAINALWNKESSIEKVIKNEDSWDFKHSPPEKKELYAVGAKIKKIIGLKLPKKHRFETGLLFTVFETRNAFEAEEKIKSLFCDLNKDFIPSIDPNKLGYILNQAEKLCQGIHFSLYDEELIERYMSSSLTTVVTYLLPYIYAQREINAFRTYERSRVLSSLPFAENGYKDSFERDGYLYEYLEYYCYKWNLFTKNYAHERPCEFDYFHRRLEIAHDLMMESLDTNLGNPEFLPLVSITKKYSPQVFEILHNQT